MLFILMEVCDARGRQRADYRGVALALMPVTIWMFMFINDAIVMDASQKNQWNMNPRYQPRRSKINSWKCKGYA